MATPGGRAYNLRSMRSQGNLNKENQEGVDERSTPAPGTPQGSANAHRSSSVPVNSAPENSSKARSDNGSRRSSRGSQSSQIQMRQIELDTEKELNKFQEEEDACEVILKRMNVSIRRTEQIIKENEEKLIEVGSDPVMSGQFKRKIQNLNEDLRRLYEDKEIQELERNQQRKLNERRRDYLMKSLNLEKDKILEENEQLLGSDDDGDGNKNMEFSDLENEPDPMRVMQFINAATEDLKNNKEVELKYLQKKLEDEAEKAAVALTLEKAAVERVQLEQHLMEKKAKADVSLQKAQEEALKRKEEIDRKVAEALQIQLDLEEELNNFFKNDQTVPVETQPPQPQTEELAKTESPTDHLLRGMAQLLEKFNPPATPATDNSKFLARQSYGKDLPPFSGKPEEWPIFNADFVRSTKDCGFSNSENMARLRKCLKGEAAKYVTSLMVSPDNVPQIMVELEERYGQPENIIRDLISKAKEVVNVDSEDLNTLIEFGAAVRNFTCTVKTLQRPEHLRNPQLQQELEDKLPDSMKMLWLTWIEDDANRARDLDHFARWLDLRRKLACKIRPRILKVDDKTPSPVQDKTDNPKKLKNKAKVVMENQKKEDIPTAAGLLVRENNSTLSCIFCEKHSDSSTCAKAQKMSLHEKQKVIREKKCCDTCLKPGHWAKSCRSFIRCPVCMERHYGFMCKDSPMNKIEKKEGEKMTKIENNVVEVSEGAPAANNLFAGTTDRALMTLIVHVDGPKGMKKVRLLIDPGADRSYVLKSLVEDIGLVPIGQESLTHNVFGAFATSTVKHNKYLLKIRNGAGNGFTNIEVRDQNKICNQIPRVKPGRWLKELRENNIWINDMDKRGSPEISILIGVDGMRQTITGRQYWLQNDLIAVETVFGWTLMGKMKGIVEDSVAMSATSLFISDEYVKRLWDLETLGIKDPAEHKNKEEKQELVKEHFLKTVTRAEDGRYSVSLPWVSDKQDIPSNRKIAEERLNYTTKKLIDIQLYEEYDQIFKGWETEGIIEKVNVENEDVPCHYLPHRAVVKPESLTTPIRPVFDASAKGYRTPSLNECLEKGPNLLELIPSILSKFRMGKIGLIGDIRKAFQMIDVKPDDRDYLRFLWWEDEASKMYKTYRHKRVVFGVNSSPFLLAAVLEHLLVNVDMEEKNIADKLLKSLYVDNVVTSVNSMEEASSFKQWSTNILMEAKMELRCWEGGFGEKSGIGSLGNSECGLDFGRVNQSQKGKEVTSVLGYKWNKLEDTLYCDLKLKKLPEKITKRVILSNCHKVFDPIGFTSPATLQPKLMLQKLWESKINWDTDIGAELKQEYLIWHSQLESLGKIRIPRNMNGWDCLREHYQLHTFCDASQLAYATVVFLRVDDGEEVSVQLVSSKSRVAPIKKMSINRLELMGSFIGARLTETIKKDLSLEFTPTYYWSDSSTVLAWIRGNDDWGTFVGNRVRSICSLTKVENWRHVPGTLNPADLPSRGCTPSQLLASNWWEGPEWLRKSEAEWPTEEINPDLELVNAEKKKPKLTTSVLLHTEQENPWYALKSSFGSNVTIMAWILRFIRNLKHGIKNAIHRGPLKVVELKLAESTIIRLIQEAAFPKDEKVISGIQIEDKKKDGLLVVKTKLFFREDTSGFRFPALLPHSHPVVDQLITYCHKMNCHAGAQFLLSCLREHYWIIGGRRAVTKVIKRCIICRRYLEKKTNVVPAPLPENRIKTAKVFEIVGVDLFGPLFLKVKKNKTPNKVWTVLFTCAVYRCIHLELVDSLSTEAFLDAFARFSARRGRPNIIYSDNGTNFVGANNLMKKLDWDKISKQHAVDNIQWIFNPPAAPWWGGFWERMVRTVKDLLRKTLGSSKLNYNKLMTYLCDVEAIVNGRPLTVVTEDPDDLIPLTPAMFLHEMPYPTVSDQQLLEASGFQRAFEDKTQYLKDIKLRFRKEYLALLVHRGKENPVREFHVGDIVLVGSDDKKRWEWPMGRIMKIFTGRDGHERVAQVKTRKGVYNRALQCLYAMEISSPNDTPEIPNINVDSDPKGNGESTKPHFPVKEDKTNQVKTRYGRTIKTPDRFKN